MDGEKRNMDELFSNGQLLPPAHPSCRCAVAYEEIPGTSLTGVPTYAIVETQLQTQQPQAAVTPALSAAQRKTFTTNIQNSFNPKINPTQQKEFKNILKNMSDGQLQLYEQMTHSQSANLYSEKGEMAAYYPDEEIIRMDIDVTPWESDAKTGHTAEWQVKFHEECHQLDHILGLMNVNFDNQGISLPAGITTITDPSTEVGRGLLQAIKNDVLAVINRAVDEGNAGFIAVTGKTYYEKITDIDKEIPTATKDAFVSWLSRNYPNDQDKAFIYLFTDAASLVTNGKITLYDQRFWGHPYEYNKGRDGRGATSETFATYGSAFFRNSSEELSVVQKLMPETTKAYGDLFQKIVDWATNGWVLAYP